MDATSATAAPMTDRIGRLPKGSSVSAYAAEDWWALVGPKPTLLAAVINQTPHDKTRRLLAPEVLGDLVIRPGDRLLVEYHRAEPQSLDGFIEHESWPIIVEGSTAASVHLEHDILTASEVVRTAVLLSVAWREPWTVRSAPFRSNAVPPSVPESWPPPPGHIPDQPMALGLIASQSEGTAPQRLPDWLAGAWTALRDDAVLWHAALAWHEGLLMQGSHPSFAAVAYVSAVEELSRTPWARSQLAGISPTSGSRQRVEAMLQLVMSGHEIKSVIETILTSRNKTAHAGRLLAFEASLGAMSALTLKFHQLEGKITPVLHGEPDDRVHEFLVGVLNPLAIASRALMLRALKDAESPADG